MPRTLAARQVTRLSTRHPERRRQSIYGEQRTKVPPESKEPVATHTPLCAITIHYHDNFCKSTPARIFVRVDACRALAIPRSVWSAGLSDATGIASSQFSASVAQ
jgi:hypothetical protein